MTVSRDDGARESAVGGGRQFASPMLILVVAVALVHLAFVTIEPSPAVETVLLFEGVVVLATGGMVAITGIVVLFFSSLWQATIGLALLWLLLAYGIHRTQLLALGVLEETNA